MRGMRRALLERGLVEISTNEVSCPGELSLRRLREIAFGEVSSTGLLHRSHREVS